MFVRFSVGIDRVPYEYWREYTFGVRFGGQEMKVQHLKSETLNAKP